jgi:hypothetical protein
MYVAVVSSAVVAGLVGLGALAPSSDTSERRTVVTTTCAQSTYAPAPAEGRAACATTYTAYGTTNR